ncbi:MAG: COQ9 family protein [Pseudomonadota bacterium]
MTYNSSYYLPADHPLFAEHLTFMQTLFEEIPFQNHFDDAIAQAQKITNMSQSTFLTLYPDGAADLTTAMVDHIIYKTDLYFIENQEELKGVKKILHSLIMYQIRLYPNMPVILQKTYPKNFFSVNCVKNSKHVFKIADSLWYHAGDTATDYNYYTKRLLLSNIYIETLLFSLSDESQNYDDTSEFLIRAFEKIKWIEKLKAKLPDITALEGKITSFFAKLRYR